MGKSLIIKGADFSAVAVDVVTVEPTEYEVLLGAGSASSFSTEGYYLSNNNYGMLYHREADGSAVKAELPAGTLLKYQGCYFIFNGNDVYPKISPHSYNLIKVNDFNISGAYKVNEGTVSLDSGVSGTSCMKIQLVAGETLVYNTCGGNTYPGLIIEQGNGTATEVDTRKTKYDIMLYTAAANVTAYISCSTTTYVNNGAFVCKKFEP